jgi:4-amino-4-deoxy-L-arabinose transferase-like glycosyltransferase
VLRLVWGIWAARGTPDGWIINGDQYSYWFFGNEIARGHGYLSYITGKPTSYYPVGYPMVLAVVYWLGLHTPLPDNQAHLTAALHVLLSTASIVLVYFIARKAFGHRVGLIAAWIVALFPSLIVGVATFSVETTFIFSALLSVAILMDHDWSSGPMSRKRLLWFGVAFGCSVLIRPFSTPIMIGLAVAVWCAGWGWRSVLRHVGWASTTFLLVLTPLTVRNAFVFHAFIPISTNVGDGMCMSRFPGSDGGFSWADHPWCADPNLPEAERNPANTKAAIRFILDHPREELRQIPKRFLLMMHQDHGTLAEALGNGSHLTLPSGVKTAIDWTTDGYYHVSWMIGLPGLILLFRRWRRDRRSGSQRAIIAITLLGLQIIPITSWGNPRFHTPMLPFIAIVAAASLDWLISRLVRSESPPADDTAGAVGEPQLAELAR